MHSSKLEHLYLSGNNLSGCLQLLCHADLSKLKHLQMSGCKLNKADIVHLSEMQLPKLSRLDLSGNTLAHCQFDLLCENSRLTSLLCLSLEDCKLNSADVKLLGIAGFHGKLQNISQLDLSENILINFTEELLHIGEFHVCNGCHYAHPSTWAILHSLQYHQVAREGYQEKDGMIQDVYNPAALVIIMAATQFVSINMN